MNDDDTSSLDVGSREEYVRSIFYARQFGLNHINRPAEGVVILDAHDLEAS